MASDIIKAMADILKINAELRKANYTEQQIKEYWQTLGYMNTANLQTSNVAELEKKFDELISITEELHQKIEKLEGKKC